MAYGPCLEPGMAQASGSFGGFVVNSCLSHGHEIFVSVIKLPLHTHVATIGVTTLFVVSPHYLWCHHMTVCIVIT